MASGTGRQSYSNTLTANTVDIALLTGGGYGVSVTNNTGTAPIWFTVDTRGGACPVPTTGGTGEEYSAASVAGATVMVRMDAQFGAVVQLISTGTPSYTVAVLGQPLPA